MRLEKDMLSLLMNCVAYVKDFQRSLPHELIKLMRKKLSIEGLNIISFSGDPF